MKKQKWVKRKEWYGYSYSLYLPETNYIVAKIMTRTKTEYDINMKKKEGDIAFDCLSEAKSEVINRLKDILKDLQNLMKEQ